MSDLNFKLSGLTCEACVKLASKRMQKVPGVYEVNIDLVSGQTEVKSEADLDFQILEKSLEDTDYSIVK
jgi:copper chaperone CopZ